MTESDGQFYQNNELVYNPMAAQNMVIKGIDEYGGQAPWMQSALVGASRGVNTSGSDLDTSTPSPKSFFSDDFEAAYSPGLMPTQVSPDWHGYQSSAYAMKRSTSSDELPSPRVVSQGCSPGISPWYKADYSHDLTGLPLALHHDSNGDRRTEYRSEPTQAQMQARFHVPRNADSQAQRQHNDKLLVQGKKDGLTYKEIRDKMIGEAPAESTLRGRYRSLTKPRKDRVRKPVWTKLDVSTHIPESSVAC